MDSPNQIAARTGQPARRHRHRDAHHPRRPRLSGQPAAVDAAVVLRRQVLWFFTEADSPKVGEIRRHPKVNLAYASKEKNIYVSIAGDARVNARPAQDQRSCGAMRSRPSSRTARTTRTWCCSKSSCARPSTGTDRAALIGKVISFLVARVTGEEEVMGENRMLDLTGPALLRACRPRARRPKRAGRKPSRSSGPPAVKSPVAQGDEESDRKGGQGRPPRKTASPRPRANPPQAPAKAARKSATTRSAPPEVCQASTRR